MSKRSATLGIVLGLALSGMGRASAADWPMWRFDAGRTASTPHALPDELHQRWVREFPAPEPAWPEEPRLHFDVAYQPVVTGKTMFVCLNRNDKLVALDTETGRQKWAFHAGGAISISRVDTSCLPFGPRARTRSVSQGLSQR